MWGEGQRDSAGATCDRTRTGCGNTEGIQRVGNSSAGNWGQAAPGQRREADSGKGKSSAHPGAQD